MYRTSGDPSSLFLSIAIDSLRASSPCSSELLLLVYGAEGESTPVESLVVITSLSIEGEIVVLRDTS
jgi:hypothetical protein